jgi:hypothetical protein
MDLQWGFNNICIRKGDKAKATFIMPAGLYKPLIMQFRLCNAPSTFQRMVDEILHDKRESSYIEVYMDDILIHTPDVEMNQVWVKRVLNKLEVNQLFCRKEKCVFEADKVEFLDMQLATGTVRVSPRKIEAILREKAPKMKKGVRRFLGLTNYNQKFI